MATDSFGFEIEVVSQYYAKYRPTYPPELYKKILQYLDEGSAMKNGRRGLAVDVGCGGGQTTLVLARHFEVVIGIDSSKTQLIEAEKASVDSRNVSYRQTSAEDLSAAVAMESADLVTVGTAIQFFDMVKFYKEAFKILKPGGVLAVYTYNMPSWKNTDADSLIHQFNRGTLKKYWPEESNHVFGGYIKPWTLLPQFFEQCIRDDSMSMGFNSNLEEVIGFIKSFPQYTYYKTEHPEYPDELDLLIERLKGVFGSNSVKQKVFQGSSPVYLLLGRKP